MSASAERRKCAAKLSDHRPTLETLLKYRLAFPHPEPVISGTRCSTCKKRKSYNLFSGRAQATCDDCRNKKRLQYAQAAKIRKLRRVPTNQPILAGSSFSKLLFASAESFVARAVQLQPEDPFGHNLQARVHMNNGKFGEAKKCAETAVELDKQTVESWLTLAELHGRIGQRS